MEAGQTDSKRFEAHREFLKGSARKQVDSTQTAQAMHMPAPPLQKPCAADAVVVELLDGAQSLTRVANVPLSAAIIRRESVREFANAEFSLEELSAILWSTQGIRKTTSSHTALRTVPSAGARHAFETYIVVRRVEGLSTGLYRYLPVDHKLEQVKLDEQISIKAAAACLGQIFVATAPLALFWTVIPERMEWRYDLAAHKILAIDVGHVCQNLYLVSTALGAGTCAIAAYDQKACDDLLGVDGNEEFTIYVAPIGRLTDDRP
ncbi:MAG: SagB/ThcOx family dehydrogenase [Candidatus Riflebacteria bacterium]|nr:SagB/ThcOx family dehydrogenase [Candidatus Riflebacteria bacterium]